MTKHIFLKILFWVIYTASILGAQEWMSTGDPKPLIQAAIHFNRLGIRKGLAHYTVFQVHQDQSGFMWFGTNKGLDRFDGHRFLNFSNDPDNPLSLSFDSVSAIYESPDGTLWIGTDGGGLNRFNTKKQSFQRFLPRPNEALGSLSNRIGCISPMGDGVRLLVGTYKGIQVFNTETCNFEEQSNFENEWKGIQNLNSLMVFSVIYHEKNLIIGTNKGLHILSQGEPVLHGLGEVRALVLDADNLLWVGCDQGVGVISRDSKIDMLSVLAGKRVNALAFDPFGYMWIGTQKGLIRYHLEPKEFAVFTHDKSDPYSLSYDNVFDVKVDSSGVVWVATWGGGISKTHSRTSAISRISSNSNQPGSLSNNEVMSLLKDRSGNTWIGTWNAGLNRLSPGGSGFSIYKAGPDSGSMTSNSVTSLLEDHQGRIWVGTRGGGLHLYNPLRDNFQTFSFDPKINSRVHLMHALHQDERGDIWVGTSGGGLVRFNPDTHEFKVFRHGDGSGLSDNGVWAMADGGPGKLWVGTSMGLNLLHIDEEQFDVFLHNHQVPGSLPYNRIQCFAEGPDHTLFIGTGGGGLAIFDRLSDTPEFQPINIGSSRFNVVQSLEKDEKGFLWVATDRNLIRLSPDLKEKKYFDVVDGTQAMGYMTNCSLLDPKGRVWFGGLDGVTIIDPSHVQASTPQGKIVFTDFLLFNESVDVTDSPQGVLSRPIHLTSKIELKYSDHPIAFEFSLLQYDKPGLHRFSYRMDGVDHIWIETGGSSRRASYSRLAPGTYRFRVKGLNADSIWSEEASIEIHVLAPWWMNSWVRGGALAFLAALIFVAHRIQLSRTKRAKQQLEAKVQTRTIELMEANKKLALASRTDALTGLHNRRGFVEAAQQELSIAQRKNRKVVIGLADIDHFKKVNDRYGHNVGDEVLKNIANILRKGVRTHDMVGRWGGEEFIFLFPETEMAEVHFIADRIRKVIQQSTVEVDGTVVNVTITIGLNEFNFDDTFEANIKLADQALYSGKEMGRNCVV